MEIEEKAMDLLRNHALCDHCLGRMFARYGRGLKNEERGKSIKAVLTMEAHNRIGEGGKEDLQYIWKNGAYQPAANVIVFEGEKAEGSPLACEICGGVLDHMDEAVKAALNELSDLQWRTFLVATVGAEEIMVKEEKLAVDNGLQGYESIKWEINREVGKILSQLTGKEVDLKNPDVLVQVHPLSMTVSLQVSPIYVYGRYLKLERGIPQSKWVCSYCNGKGCPRCNYTGKKYPTSVEEEIASALVPLARASGDKFHAAGREDVDARMLGSGRPFVMELESPKIREIDLSNAAEMIKQHSNGKVEVRELRLVGKDFVNKVKSEEKNKKVYEGEIESSETLTDEDVQVLNSSFNGLEITQRTPQRVSRRRADLVRKKFIYELKVEKISENELKFYVQAEGGTYIKELISGDEGRTLPSLSSKIGKPLKCKQLDVMEVEVPFESKGI
ncbi:MAG: tRNA pseudouridine(54/55) synthase Pus10 [Thermoprotei archaeon]